MLRRSLLSLLLAALPGFSQQASEIPWALNLPTAQGLEQGNIDLRFTHRFTTPAKGNSKEAYGLDQYAFAALGFEMNFASWPGMTFQAYRSADEKTLTLALAQKLILDPTFQVALRIERFDETVKDKPDTQNYEEGKLGTAVQLPVEWRVAESFRLILVPTWLSRTNLKRDAITTAGFGARFELTPQMSFLAEFYPRPSKLKDVQVIENDQARPLRTGWALGYSYRTRGHRFTLLGTNVIGTTTHQVLSGDYGGFGPRQSGNWVLGFNIERMF